MFSFTEDTFEQAVIELFENMGYTHIYAPDMNRTDYSRPLLDDVLRDCLVRLNRSLPAVAIDEAILKLNDFDAGSLLQKNIIFMDYLQNGITVKYAVKGEERSSVVKLIDYADADNNDFYVVNQYTFVENGNNRRPDITLFINGMPLVLMELKSPSKDEVGAENAYNQIRNYMQDIPSMFYYNAICVISDLSTPPTKQVRLLPGLTVLWNGKQKTVIMKTLRMRSLIPSMRECSRKSGCWTS